MRGFLPRSRPLTLVLSVGIGLIILIPGQTRDPDDSVPIRKRAAISSGSTAYLSDGGRPIGVGADLKTFDALAEAVVAKDRKAYEHLFQDGHAFLVDDGVRVVVINLQAKTAEVQFLEGYHSQKSAFVFREWLKSER